MNYSKVYNNIIDRAKDRTLEGYSERHHIVPKCVGGRNEKSNLVDLTAREHFICHLLLREIYPNEPKLVHAAWLLAHTSKAVKIGGRVYERLKIERSKLLKETSHLKKENRTWESSAMKGRKGKLHPTYGRTGRTNPAYINGQRFREVSSGFEGGRFDMIERFGLGKDAYPLYHQLGKGKINKGKYKGLQFEIIK